jgi:uncharacterized membrane protein (UPF0127 family)
VDKILIHGVHAEVAKSFFQRLKGLMWRKFLPSGEGMLILKCNAIHTCFMRFAIDAAFLDRDDNVVKVVRNIRPWRFCVWGGRRAVKVLETASVTENGK